MPIYEAVCLKCGKYRDYVSTVANCMTTPECCGAKTDKRILSAPTGLVDIPAYESPASGKMITSRAERREDFKRTGTREWEGLAAEKQEAARQDKYRADAQDAALDKTVRTAWAQLSPSKKAAALAA